MQSSAVMFEIQTLLTWDSAKLTTSAHGGSVSLKGRIRTSLRKENGGSQYQVNIKKPCGAFGGVCRRTAPSPFSYLPDT